MTEIQEIARSVNERDGFWYRTMRQWLFDADLSEQQESRGWSYLHKALAEAFEQGRESMRDEVSK